MLKLSCHCGQVRVELDRRPDYIRECNGTLCGWAAVTTHFTLTEGVVATFGNIRMGELGRDLRRPEHGAGRARRGHTAGACSP